MTTGSRRSIINITPLIDILLVLMMIMMVITPIASHGLPAAVPERSKDQAPAETPLVLRIDRDSQLWLNQERLREADFAPRLTQLLARRADAVLFIQGDAELPFAAVASVVDRARGVGFTRAAILP
ncbi:MAG: biopolymer transporter ExbD [Bryobacteraceae bacterium]|nr:biopolymer transporter ExbD [Bryobacteraceae bacterium]